MGQYYMICNLDKKQSLNPHKFGDGLKLMEFGCNGCGTMTALAILLSAGNGRGGGDFRHESKYVGSWAGDRIVIAGDYYGDQVEDVKYEEAGEWTAKALAEAYGEDWRDLSYAAELIGEPMPLYSAATYGAKWKDISEPVAAMMRKGDSYLAEHMRKSWG